VEARRRRARKEEDEEEEEDDDSFMMKRGGRSCGRRVGVMEGGVGGWMSQPRRPRQKKQQCRSPVLSGEARETRQPKQARLLTHTKPSKAQLYAAWAS
jgi:hypothetical protein